MELVIRPISESENDVFNRVMMRTFLEDWSADIDALKEFSEWDRSLAVFDRDEMVATGGIYTFDMCVPGGAFQPTAGVTWITVASTHRRRGILRSMMTRQMKDIHERGEPLAALWAAESSIYGRFGYGMAVPHVRLTIESDRAALADATPPNGQFRLVDRDTALAQFPSVYDSVVAGHPGLLRRSPVHWRRRTFEGAAPPAGMTRRHYVLYEVAGEARGYAAYRARDHWTDDLFPTGEVMVQELMAVDSEAYAAMWSYCLNIDLTTRVKAHQRRLDEPLPFLLADPRRVRTELADGLWVRLVDVPKALGGRRYAAAASVVIDVVDDFCPWNTGRFRLDADAEGRASCDATDASPDLRIAARELGAAYLGTTRLRTLAEARLVDELTPGALDRVDRMFGWHQPAWCAEVF
jgi:predicted acetyltransferase